MSLSKISVRGLLARSQHISTSLHQVLRSPGKILVQDLYESSVGKMFLRGVLATSLHKISTKGLLARSLYKFPVGKIAVWDVSFGANLQNQTAHGCVIRAIWCQNLQKKMPRFRTATHDRNRNAHGHFTTAILWKFTEQVPDANTAAFVLCEFAQSKCQRHFTRTIWSLNYVIQVGSGQFGFLSPNSIPPAWYISFLDKIMSGDFFSQRVTILNFNSRLSSLSHRESIIRHIGISVYPHVLTTWRPPHLFRLQVEIDQFQSGRFPNVADALGCHCVCAGADGRDFSVGRGRIVTKKQRLTWGLT